MAVHRSCTGLNRVAFLLPVLLLLMAIVQAKWAIRKRGVQLVNYRDVLGKTPIPEYSQKR
ncbi:hypothetical protein GCM10023187_00430 [Nibrella viscosa]|uniref:Uncharacterized protein n=1 Tax=Nibrella viscosa TaxID=1084524 RepID=A0ABP8JQ91_9BACT